MKRSTYVKSKISLLVVTLLLSRCVLVPVVDESPTASSNGNSASGSSSAGTYTISLSAEDVMGRTDGNGDPSTATFSYSVNGQAASLPSGATVECRTYPINGTVTAYAACTPNATTGKFNLSFDASKPIGRYKTEARVSYQGVLSNAASVTYYLHEALDGTAKCTPANSASAYFAAAAAVLPASGTFGNHTNLVAPINTIQLNASHSYNTDMTVLSLHKRFTKNSANTLILLTRKYESQYYGCVGIRHWQRGTRVTNHFHEGDFDAIVFDAMGHWAGFKNGTATVALTGDVAERRFRNAGWSTMSNNRWQPFNEYWSDSATFDPMSYSNVKLLLDE